MAITIKNDLALSILSYESTDKLAESKLWQEMSSDGWEHLGHSSEFFKNDNIEPPTNGFEAQVFRSPEGEVVIAYTGTNGIDDLDDDALLWLGGKPPQQGSAKELADLIIKSEGIDTLHVTGHSLGGHLAQVVTTFLKEKYSNSVSITGGAFNVPGIGEADEQDPDFYNINGDSDLVHHSGGEHLGGSVIIDSSVSLLRLLTAHSSEELYNEMLSRYPELGEISAKEFASWDSEQQNEFVSSAFNVSQEEMRAIIQQAAVEREAELDLMSSQIALRDAINSGDGLDIAREGAGYLSSLDNRNDVFLNDNNPATEDGFLEQSGEAILNGIEHGIGLGQAIDDGDGWEIAGNSIDLLRDIEGYLDANGGGFFDVEGVGSGATALTIASSGLALAEAIEDGDGWGIASSTTSLLQGVDNYVEGGIGVGGETLAGVGSAIGLAANIASFDDVLESGDALNIAYTTASTVNNAIGVYNAIVGSTNAIASNIPIISIIAIGTQLAMGDVRGAAVTALTTAALCIPVYGWAVAAAIQIVNLVAGGDDPPSATADFALDENGNVIMDVHGDSDMKDSVQAAASPLVAIIQNYKKLGGRVTIDGSLPSLRMEAGKDPEIKYTSEYGGKVVISVADRSRLGLDMRGALYARDRGDRVDDAIKTARDSNGNINFAKVDAALAAMGFSKRGMTYTYGESWTPRIGFTYGNGVFTGGGNANGPQGQHFVAGDKDIKSLPLTPEQRPSQTVGKLLSAVSLQHNFAGASGLLLAMGLGLDVDQACASAFYGQIEHPETNPDYVKPLDAAALERYLTNGNGPYEQQGAQSTDSNSIPPITDEADLQAILSSQIPGLGSTFDPFADQSGVSGF
ncbi:Protein of unknown function (DUF2974) [Desulfocapsa sulfexigens DSM 10523]|uniref:Uncharacterized protein n=1 Tax=Desulfocapsa sulfexigens (strain DSM 10523 / SB164P1) TaxID=1167006 RepID=M1P0I1_DESSD|nr:lipase family protein [Desulfocapsa sulfexigens]AGF76993.1 Protein of unknown function (DUF2974) [Desulfocapsa sulfexigens DSM 10523]